MSISFEGPAVFVADVNASRAFYEKVFDQSVLFAVEGSYVAFEGGFSLWQQQSADALIHGKSAQGPATPQGRENFEMYFETEDLEGAWQRIRAVCAEPIHAVREMPWGQRCFRVRDPDGHIIEVGEPMAVVVRRFLDQGLPPEEVAERTMAPLEFVQSLCGCEPD